MGRGRGDALAEPVGRVRPGPGAVALLAAVLLAGCGGGHSSSSESVPSAGPEVATTGTAANTIAVPRPAVVRPGARLASGFRLTSPAFRPGGAIPRAFTCDGRDVSLPLRYSGVPRAARELVLVMRDPDAPSGNFVHWAVAGIQPSTRAFQAAGVPGLIVPGRNSYGTLGYRGPCPPRGTKAHHYVLTLIALSGRSGLRNGFNPDQLRVSALAIATLVGTYARR
jgi:Raf kinase inhibitor-like YbhB/YbcL family protein